MGYVVRPRCLTCKHEWPDATVGNAKSFICICNGCKNVVNVDRNGFRRELQPCPECDASLSSLDVVDVFNAPGDSRGTIASGIKCPRCETGDLSFRSVLHFSIEMSDRAPAKGELVHGYFEGGKLKVPGMWLMKAKPIIYGTPENVGDRLMELRTVEIRYHDKTVESIEFEFLGMAEH